MRVLLCLMVLLPFVLSAELQERILISATQLADDGLRLLGFSSWIYGKILVSKSTGEYAHISILSGSDLVHNMIELVGSDEVEHACESTACPKFIELVPDGNRLPRTAKSPFCKVACQQARAIIDKD